MLPYLEIAASFPLNLKSLGYYLLPTISLARALTDKALVTLKAQERTPSIHDFLLCTCECKWVSEKLGPGACMAAWARNIGPKQSPFWDLA